MTLYDVIDITTQAIVTFSSKQNALRYMMTLTSWGHNVVTSAYRNLEGKSVFLGELNSNL